MSYIVFCTFDLKNADSNDYKNAYSDLEKIGLKKVVKSDENKEVVIPTTSTMGEFEGESSGAVRDDIREKVKKAFKARGFDSEIFLVVGKSWAWGATTT
ncbi:MAG: hypothetical protein WD512_12940 [Candidatus Paceibacterota bacterium]